MAKPKSAKGSAATAPAAMGPEVTAQVAALKAQADALYGKNEYTKAVETYDQAFKLIGSASVPGKSDMCLKKAASYMRLQKYKEAVKECTMVLDSQPGQTTALRTRSQAYEQMNFFKNALGDVQAINKSKSATDETLQAETRLKATMASNKTKLTTGIAKTNSHKSKKMPGTSGMGPQPSHAASAASNNNTTKNTPAAPTPAPTPAAPAAPNRPPQNPYYVTIKCSHGEDTRIILASLMLSYAELHAAVQAKFPNLTHFKLTYTDKGKATTTITARKEIQSYLAELIQTFQRQGPVPKNTSPELPPMKLQVVPCSEADVPQAPAEELAAQEANKPPPKEAQEPPAPVEYEFEPWLLRFAKLFSEVTGIDPAAEAAKLFDPEQATMEHEKMARAMETTLTSEGAKPLFDRAAEHFKDATCATLIQWGNVHVVKAEKHAQSLLKEGKELSKADVDMMLKEYKLTEDKIKQALTFKSNSWEAIGSMGQLEWERVKAKLCYIVPSPQALEETASEGKTPEQAATEAQAAVSDAVKKTLSKLTEKEVKGVQSLMKSANEWFQKALTMARTADESLMKSANEWFEKALTLARTTDEEKKKDDAEIAGATPTLAAEKKPELSAEQLQQQQLASPTGNMLIMHGNVLYEWSQVLAAVKQTWKPTLDSAVEKFRTAGASESEIRAALKNHTNMEELDLGPDPEPETPAPHVHTADCHPSDDDMPALEEMQATPAGGGPSQVEGEAKPAAKGLPSLPAKGKKK
eukprot:gene18328-24790_t